VNIPRALATIAIAVTCNMAALAQQQPSGYHSVWCLKVNPGKGAEHRKWWDEEGRKVMQATIDSGEVTTFYRLRAVVPSGSSATCDVVIVSFYPGLPPEPTSKEQFEALLRKAGITSSPEDYAARRDAARTAVSNQIFQNQVALGSIKKGDYVTVSYMKTAHIGEWLNMEKTIWQPIADALIKAGAENAWSVNLLILPNGDDLPYQGVAVDAYPTLAAAVKAQILDPSFDALFKKAHPGMDEEATLQTALKTRTQSLVYLFQVEDVLTSTK